MNFEHPGPKNEPRPAFIKNRLGVPVIVELVVREPRTPTAYKRRHLTVELNSGEDLYVSVYEDQEITLTPVAAHE